jgi:hypothetical protein
MFFRRILVFWALVPLIFPPALAAAPSWNGSIPEDLRRPRRGESPRYPQDLVIGDLGAGEAPEGAYLFGRQFLAALIAENRSSPALAGSGSQGLNGFFEALRSIGAQKYRIGGGREEEDGCVSFLVRFLGRERGITGELYLRQEDGQWLLDDLVLEEAADMVREKDPYRYDFSPYERFY